MTKDELEIKARIDARLKQIDEMRIRAARDREHINREMAKMREEAYEYETEQLRMKQMTETNTKDTAQYFIIAKHRYWDEHSHWDSYVEKHALDPKRIIRLTDEDARLLSLKLERMGDELVLLRISDPDELNYRELIEQERAFQTEQAEKRKALEEARKLKEAERQQQAEVRKKAKQEASKQTKLKQLAKLKKELGVE
jgi:hypothetical protein